MDKAMKKNPHAIALGRLAKGKPKTVTPLDREGRIKRLEDARAMLARIRAGIEKKEFTP